MLTSSIEFWVDRRGLKIGISTTRREVYGHDPEENRAYQLREPVEG